MQAKANSFSLTVKSAGDNDGNAVSMIINNVEIESMLQNVSYYGLSTRRPGPDAAGNYRQGLNIAIIDEITGRPTSLVAFIFKAKSELGQFVEHISKIEFGNYIAIAIMGKGNGWNPIMSHPDTLFLWNSIIGGSRFSSFFDNDNYVLLGQKGTKKPTKAEKYILTGSEPSVVSLTLELKDVKPKKKSIRLFMLSTRTRGALGPAADIIINSNSAFEERTFFYFRAVVFNRKGDTVDGKTFLLRNYRNGWVFERFIQSVSDGQSIFIVSDSSGSSGDHRHLSLYAR